MQYKLRKNLIQATLILTTSLLLGGSIWAIVYSVQVQQRNKPYNKFYLQNINGVDVYFRVENSSDDDAVLLANKYVEIGRDAFVSNVDNKLYVNDELLLENSNINLKWNRFENNEIDFYPTSLVDGQTKIKIVNINAAGDALMDPTEITYFDKATNGIALSKVGFFSQRPNKVNDEPQSGSIKYRVTENNENLYYLENWNTTSYKKEPSYHHAKRYASSIISPTSYSKPIYYRFLDDFDFLLNEDNLLVQTIGLSDTNVELIETLPEGILEKNTHVAMPSYFEVESYYIHFYSWSDNTVYRRIKKLKGAI